MDVVTLSAAKADAKAKYPAATPAGQDRLVAAQSKALAPWYWGLAAARAGGSPARIAVVGDSVTEGQGATTMSKRWINVLADTLRAEMGLPGAGINFIPAWAQESTFTKPWALSGSVTLNQTRGWGARVAVIPPGQTATLTFTGTSATICNVSGLAGMAPATMSVDGGGATTITPTTSGGEVVQKTSTGALTAGSHTILITATGTSFYLWGAYTFNGDEASGIQVVDGGHYGYTASSWGGNLYSCSRDFLPQLCIIMIGLNDYGTQVPSATYATNVAAIMTNLRNGANASNNKTAFLLLGSYQRGDTAYGLQIEPWANYMAALGALTVATTDAAFLDMSPRMPPLPLTSPAAYGVISGSDLIHPTNAGHQHIADSVRGFILPR
jgi:lysophospholipase L1-like esterase